MTEKNKDTLKDKLLFPSNIINKISGKKNTCIVAILALGLLNALPAIIESQILQKSVNTTALLGNIFIFLILIFLNGLIDAITFNIPLLTFSSSLTPYKSSDNGFTFLYTMIKIYVLTHIPLKFVEYSLNLIQAYKVPFLINLTEGYLNLGVIILIVGWFSMSIGRSIKKLLVIEDRYEFSIILTAFGWLNLTSIAFEYIMKFAFSIINNYHF